MWSGRKNTKTGGEPQHKGSIPSIFCCGPPFGETPTITLSPKNGWGKLSSGGVFLPRLFSPESVFLVRKAPKNHGVITPICPRGPQIIYPRAKSATPFFLWGYPLKPLESLTLALMALNNHNLGEKCFPTKPAHPQCSPTLAGGNGLWLSPVPKYPWPQPPNNLSL